jgi:hypothetical protein
MLKGAMNFSVANHTSVVIDNDVRGLEKEERLVELPLRTTCRGGGMADAADLKSSLRPST